MQPSHTTPRVRSQGTVTDHGTTTTLATPAGPGAEPEAETLRERFERDGYVILDGLLTEHAAIKALLEELLQRPREGAAKDWNSGGFVQAPGWAQIRIWGAGRIVFWPRGERYELMFPLKWRLVLGDAVCLPYESRTPF